MNPNLCPKCGAVDPHGVVYRGCCDACSRTTHVLKEKEMEPSPIERLATAAEKYVEKCDENDPLQKQFIMAQLNHIDRQYDPMPKSAELRAVWDRAYFAYASAGESIENCKEFAGLTVSTWPTMIAERDALITKVV